MKKAFLILTLTVLCLTLCSCGEILENYAPTEYESAGEGVLTAPATPLQPNGQAPTVPAVPIQPNGQTPTVPPSTDAEDAPTVSEPQSEKAVYVRSKTDGLNVRLGAGTAFSSAGTLDKGDMVVFLGEENGWYKTWYRSRTAYVSASEKYTELYTMEKSDAEVEEVINVGLRLLGTPYVYGATRYHDGSGRRLSGFSTDAFDCSSLMQYMFFIGADVKLDLTTRTQILQGNKVSELKRGDLMFFTNASRKNKTGIERVGHVALYLGNNYILHTASDHAVIEEISAVRWSYFIQARRNYHHH